MEKRTRSEPSCAPAGTARAVLPAGPLGAAHCALAEGLDKAQAAMAFGLRCGYRPSTAMVRRIKDTATGAITVTVNYQRP